MWILYSFIRIKYMYNIIHSFVFYQLQLILSLAHVFPEDDTLMPKYF